MPTYRSSSAYSPVPISNAKLGILQSEDATASRECTTMKASAFLLFDLSRIHQSFEAELHIIKGIIVELVSALEIASLKCVICNSSKAKFCVPLRCLLHARMPADRLVITQISQQSLEVYPTATRCLAYACNTFSSRLKCPKTHLGLLQASR